MQFFLQGFIQNRGFRVFAFQGVAEDRTRSDYSVSAEIDLIRRHGIRVQELPLLCRELLEQRCEGVAEHAFTYTEENMRRHAVTCAAEREEALRKKSKRKFPINPNGGGWRVPMADGEQETVCQQQQQQPKTAQ